MSLMKKKYVPRRRKAPRRRRMAPRRGARVALPKRTTGNFASATEQFSLAVTAGVVNDFTFDMTDLIRTRALMNVYQYYRITSVEMRFKPLSDTYIAGGAANLPYLNFQYDKSGALLGTMTANNFEQIGTKAIRLDDKTLIRKWKPSVLTKGLDAGGVSQFKVSPWLPTFVEAVENAAVSHYGATFYISKQNPSDATAYDVDVVVNVQFRKPLVTVNAGEQVVTVNPPRVKQGTTTAVDVSLNPQLGH